MSRLAFGLALLGLGTLPLWADGVSTPMDPSLFAPASSIVQAANVTTDSGGNWTVTWSQSFVSSTPLVTALPINTAAAAPIVCNPTSTSKTSASGKCWSLANSIAILGIQLNAPASGISVRVGGRDLTQ